MGYFIHSSSYIEDNVSIGSGCKIWHFCHIDSGATLGDNCNLGQNIYIGKNVVVGCGVKLQNNVSVYSGVTLMDWVFCGPSVVFTNDLTPRAKHAKTSNNYKKTLVKQSASLGANSTIIAGVTIGCYAMIGAGAVVTSDVKNHSLVVGNPAKHIGWVCSCGSRLKDNLLCNCGHSYTIASQGLVVVADS